MRLRPNYRAFLLPKVGKQGCFVLDSTQMETNIQLKTDENGNVVVQDGKPVYMYDDGQEIAFDAMQNMAKISQLNAEAKQHREAKEKAETLLKAFDGLNADDAKKALETVKNLDDKRLIDAGEVEKVKAEAKKAFDEQLAEKDAQINKIKQEYNNAVIGGAFARSSFIKDKTLLPSDIVQSSFGSHFTMENGKIVANLGGNPIYSRKNPGELADFDEALEIIISQYPHKDSILRGSGASGAGVKHPLAQAGTTNLKRSQMSLEQKSAFIKEHGQTAYLNLGA